MNNFISTNKKFYFCFSIGQNKIVQQENNNILDKILVSLFYCLEIPLPEELCILSWKFYYVHSNNIVNLLKYWF